MFVPLTGIYEPSAIQQLADGRFLVVEDEKTHPFSLVTLHGDGTSSSKPLILPTMESDSPVAKLDDLEGLAADNMGFIYAITSHSRTGGGEVKKAREKLVRFRVEEDRMSAPKVVTELKNALTAAHPALAAAVEVRDVKSAGGLNIEALEMTPDGARLLLGFRGPLREGQALVASIENPVPMFENQAQPAISTRLEALDLGGHGIRGMSWCPTLEGYLLISGPVDREPAPFALWFWRGQPGDVPRRVTVPGLPGFEHAEGISPAEIDGRRRIIVVSDDGDRAAGRPARYLLLDPGQLRIDA